MKQVLNRLFSSDNLPIVINEPQELISKTKIRRILLLRHDRLGDILISLPFIKHLREYFDEAEIDILLNYKNSSGYWLTQGYCNSHYILTRNIVSSWNVLKQLKNRNYDLVIDLLDNESLNSNIVLKLLKKPVKLGFDKSNGMNYNILVRKPEKSTTHPVTRLQNLFLPFGLSPKLNYDEVKIDFGNVNESDLNNLLGYKTKTRLGINLSGSTSDKNWGVVNYSSFIKSVKSDYPDIDIILFTTESNKEQAMQISERTESRVAPFQKDFRIFSYMISTCDLVLTPDTSVVHLGSILGIPMIVMYKHSADGEDQPWYPLGVPYKAMIDSQKIENIKVHRVLEAFSELMAEIKQ